ncbi:hypothetical protein MT418_006900 [Batrachochytrium dendrobatidis]
MPILVTSGDPEIQAPEASYSGNTSRNIALHIQKNVKLAFDPVLAGMSIPPKGDLYITQSQLLWFDPATKINVSIDYPSIMIHAISRQGDLIAEGPYIYCQISGSACTENTGTAISVNDPSTEASVADGDSSIEMRLVPDDPTSLDAIYQAMSDCAALHPDPDMDMDEDESDNEAWTFDPATAEDLQFSEVGRAALEHLESVFGITTRPDIPETDVPETESEQIIQDANGNITSNATGLTDSKEHVLAASRTAVTNQNTNQFDDAEENR